MRNVLLAANTHNVLRSAPAMLFSSAVFRWLEMPLPKYPQVRQCILRPAGKRSRGALAGLCRIPAAS